MSKHAESESEAINLYLCFYMHTHETMKFRAIKLAKSAKFIRDRTKNKDLYNACRSMIKYKEMGKYSEVVKAIQSAEENYWRGV